MKIDAVQLEPKEYVTQSRVSGELTVGRPVLFTSNLPKNQIAVACFSEVDGWLIEAPQATKMNFFLNPEGFEHLMEVLGEL